MKPRITAVALAVVGIAALPAAALRGAKPGPCVTFARTWDAAVEEGKLLNLPLVVHNHGFY